MGQFKPMVKMYTTEPSVELKLKRGGHVNMKKGGHAKVEKETGHKSMHHMMDGGVMGALAGTPALVGRPAVNAPVRFPGKPSMAMRRKAMMPVRPAAGMMKEGGDADKAQDKAMIKKAFKMHDKQEHKGEHTDLSKLKHGGKAAGGLEHHKAMVKHYAEKCKDGGSPHMQKMLAHHKHMVKMCKGGSYASGGEIDSFETKTTVKGNEGKYDKTMMHGTPKGKTSGKTGDVKEGNAGGYKRGGKVKMSVGGDVPSETSYGDYETTKVYSAKPDRASGTGGVKEEQGGFKRGGSTHKYAKGGEVGRYVTDNVVGTPPGVTNRTTGGVREGNAGGYKKGGHSKKAFATGGLVDDGRPVAMPQGRKPASKPVSNDRQSGTFKRGGRVKMDEGGILAESAIPADIEDQLKTNKANREYKNWERMQREENMSDREMIPNAIKRAAQGIRGIFSSKPPAGSVTKTERSVTVAPAKKRGGRC